MAKTPKSEATYQRVLECAVRLFGEQGYERTTMRDLSRQAQLGLGALYYYFRSKEEIVQAFYQQMNQRWVDSFAWRPQEDLASALPRLLEAKLVLLQPHRGLLRVLMREAIDPESPLCPLHPNSTAARDVSLSAFERLDAERARLLWLAHMGVLLFWLHDRSPGQASTRQAIGLLARWLKWLPMLSKLPGVGSFRTQLQQVVEGLFLTPDPGKDSGSR